MSIIAFPPISAGGGTVADATETTAGKIRIATSAEATAGTNDLIAMTPKTVADEISAATLGLFDYKGELDASQPNTPDISNAVKGDFYKISVDGTIYGETWAVGDSLVINADMGGVVDNAKIDKFDNTDAVTSVNGLTGPVVLDSSNIAENTNLYYTDARVDAEVATLPLSTLSDVDYTAGAGIDGDVLTWVDASSEWQAVTPATAPVTSVNGLTGPVVLDSSNIAENTNLYYTDARVDTEVGTLPLSTLSDVDYTAGAGIDGDVLTWVDASSEWQAVTPATAPVTSVNGLTGPVVLDSSNIAENTNLYYTDARVDTEVGTLPLSTLSDVDYTGGAGIDGDVLTWVDANSRWEAVTSSASAAGFFVQTTTTAISNASPNTAYWFSAASGVSASLELPLISTLTDGDTFVITRMRAGEMVVSQNSLEPGASPTLVRYGASLASSHVLKNNYEEMVIRYSSSVFYVFQDGGLRDLVDDSTPTLGGSLVVAGHAITSTSNGDIEILPDGTGIIETGELRPDANLTRSIGSETLRYVRTYSDVDGAIIFKGKNDSGGVLTKGQAVYVKGVSGNVPTVDKARANSASTMPAFGLVYANANDQAEVQIVTFGNLTDVDTTTYSLSLGDTVYVSAATAGDLTNSAPAGEANLIQNIGRVIRADATAGIIKVGGAGRSNATPNLDQDKIFVGDATHQTVSKSLSTIGLTELNQDLTTATVSENTNLYYTDARVDAEVATLPMSTLSDVAYTPGAGIDNYVLTYDHSSTSWGAEAAAGGGGSRPSVTDITATPYTIGTTDSAIGASELERTYTASTGAGTINLPTAVGLSGFKLQIKRLTSAAVTVDPSGSQYIDYAAQTTFAIGAQYDSVTLQSDNANWILI